MKIRQVRVYSHSEKVGAMVQVRDAVLSGTLLPDAIEKAQSGYPKGTVRRWLGDWGVLGWPNGKPRWDYLNRLLKPAYQRHAASDRAHGAELFYQS